VTGWNEVEIVCTTAVRVVAGDGVATEAAGPLGDATIGVLCTLPALWGGTDAPSDLGPEGPAGGVTVFVPDCQTAVHPAGTLVEAVFPADGVTVFVPDCQTAVHPAGTLVEAVFSAGGVTVLVPDCQIAVHPAGTLVETVASAGGVTVLVPDCQTAVHPAGTSVEVV